MKKNSKIVILTALVIALLALIFTSLFSTKTYGDSVTIPEIQEETTVVERPTIVIEDETIPEVVPTEAETETIEVETSKEIKRTYLGKFRITYYCGCRRCCGKWAGSPTASGAIPEANKTIAVSKKQIPFGTKVYIEGMGTYEAQDTGSGIYENCIDVYMGDYDGAHQLCLDLGVDYLDVYIEE